MHRILIPQQTPFIPFRVAFIGKYMDVKDTENERVVQSQAEYFVRPPACRATPGWSRNPQSLICTRKCRSPPTPPSPPICSCWECWPGLQHQAQNGRRPGAMAQDQSRGPTFMPPGHGCQRHCLSPDSALCNTRQSIGGGGGGARRAGMITSTPLHLAALSLSSN